MNRFILFVAALVMALGCERANPEVPVEKGPEEEVEIGEETYVFHDDFYQISGGRIELEKCPEDFYVIIRKDSLDAAKIYLSENGFTVIKELAERYDSQVEGPSDYMALTVNGKNEVSSIPGSVYFSNLYLMPECVPSDELRGMSNILFVYLSECPKEERLDVLNEYVRQHNLYIVNERSDGVYKLACSKKSSGNMVEMANWFTEVAGLIAEPNFMLFSIN